MKINVKNLKLQKKIIFNLKAFFEFVFSLCQVILETSNEISTCKIFSISLPLNAVNNPLTKV